VIEHRGSRARRLGLLAALPCLLAGCGNDQSTLSPASHATRDISALWWWMLIGSGVVFAVVVALLALGLLRRRGLAPADRTPVRGGTWVVAIGGLAVPLAVCVALFAATIKTLPTASASGKKTSFTVDVTGRQWFWDVDYPGKGVRTANEIHIPVGVSVLVKVTSDDVIHSLWVPALNRKIDVIPGDTNEVVFRASHAGVFRGQCAEFCGLQHAHMALYVIAEPQAAFDAWVAQESRPPPPPPTAALERGQQIFLGSACEYCHTIAGTNASGTIGPDLTHFASRLSIGAATIPNTKGYLAGWILDPQHVKPGNRMPATALGGAELQSLLGYLESLD
jgi:cytochrome c oxidase subunit 2